MDHEARVHPLNCADKFSPYPPQEWFIELRMLLVRIDYVQQLTTSNVLEHEHVMRANCE